MSLTRLTSPHRAVIREFSDRLTDGCYPFIVRLNETHGVQEMISGPNLWNSAMALRKSWVKCGYPAGSKIQVSTEGIHFAVQIFAALIGGYVIEPHLGAHLSPIFDPLTPEIRATNIENAVWFQMHSSGTTGAPKEIKLSSTGVLWQLKRHHDILKLERGQTRLCALSLCHAFGLILDFLLGIYAQQTILMSPEKRMSRVVEILNQYSVDGIALVPRQLELLLRESDHFTQLTWIHTGGALIRPDLKRAASAKCTYLWEGYGLTEAGPGVLINGDSIGAETKIVDSELWIKIPSLQTNLEKPLTDGWFRTGDAVESIDGKIFPSGRMGRQHKSLAGTWDNLDQLENRWTHLLGATAVSIQKNPLQLSAWDIALAGDSSQFGQKTIKNFEETLLRQFGVTCTFRILSVEDHFWNEMGKMVDKSLARAIEKLGHREAS